MTILEQPTTPVGFQPVLKDVTLEHQLDLAYASKSRREVVAVCNCGWRGIPRRPDHPEPTLNVLAAVAEYEGHLVGA